MMSTFSNHTCPDSNWERFQPTLQHFIKNKLQGINGGSYLVDYGLTNECLETVENGWKIVRHNQYDIMRCTSALMLANRQPKSHLERVSFDEIVQAALEDFDRRYPTNSLLMDRILALEPVDCDVDVTGLQACLLNLLRFLESVEPQGDGGLEIEIWVADVRLYCQIRSPRAEIGIDQFGQVHSVNLTSDKVNVLSVEWLSMQKMLTAHSGRLAFSQLYGVIEFRLELPIEPTGGL